MVAMVGLVAVMLVIAGRRQPELTPQRGAHPGATGAGLRGALADVLKVGTKSLAVFRVVPAGR